MTAITSGRRVRTFEQVVAEATDGALAAFLRFARARLARRPSRPVAYAIAVVRRERAGRERLRRSLPRA